MRSVWPFNGKGEVFKIHANIRGKIPTQKNHAKGKENGINRSYHQYGVTAAERRRLFDVARLDPKLDGRGEIILLELWGLIPSIFR